MFDERHTLLSWGRDIALAYAGGLVIGAPVATGAVWITGIERLATVALLMAMAVVLVALRRGVPRAGASAIRPEQAAGAVEPAARVTRRVA